MKLNRGKIIVSLQICNGILFSVTFKNEIFRESKCKEISQKYISFTYTYITS